MQAGDGETVSYQVVFEVVEVEGPTAEKQAVEIEETAAFRHGEEQGGRLGVGYAGDRVVAQDVDQDGGVLRAVSGCDTQSKILIFLALAV